jgi:hypothetical protein
LTTARFTATCTALRWGFAGLAARAVCRAATVWIAPWRGGSGRDTCAGSEDAADAWPCEVAAIVIGNARPARIGISHVFRRTASPGCFAHSPAVRWQDISRQYL